MQAHMEVLVLIDHNILQIEYIQGEPQMKN